MRVSDGRLSVLKSMYKFGVYNGVELPRDEAAFLALDLIDERAANAGKDKRITELERELAEAQKDKWQLWPSETNEAAYPPDETLVLIYCGNWSSKDFSLGQRRKRCGMFGPSGASHWQPLPAPPVKETP